MMKAMVMAAGAGTRLHPLTHRVAKPVVPILDRPVLAYTLDNLSKHGVRDVAMNLHAFPDQIKSLAGDGNKWGLRVTYSHEPDLLGTAGGVKKMESFFGKETCLILSGDGLTDIDLTALLAFHRKQRTEATMVLVEQDARLAYGVVKRSSQGHIKGFLEKPRWGEFFSKHINAGIYVLEPSVFKLIPRGRVFDFGNQVWPLMLKLKKKIATYVHTGYWCDIGNLQEYRRSQKDLLDGSMHLAKTWGRWSHGLWFESKKDVDIHPTARLIKPSYIASGVRVGARAIIGPYTVLGQGTHVNAGASLKHSIVWAQANIETGATLSDCIVTQCVRVPKKIHVTGGILA